MLVYKDYITYTILGQEINLISDELDYGFNTVVEIDGKLNYFGNEYPTISTAVIAWQEYYNKNLNSEELRQVMSENSLISYAV